MNKNSLKKFLSMILFAAMIMITAAGCTQKGDTAAQKAETSEAGDTATQKAETSEAGDTAAQKAETSEAGDTAAQKAETSEAGDTAAQKAETSEAGDTATQKAETSETGDAAVQKEDAAETGDAAAQNSMTRFKFTVVDREGTETSFDVETDKETVGEALLEEKLIEGEDGAYGLYVKKVNGIEAVYENDGTYWAFYINGEYAMTGVDTTKAENGATYTFKVEGN